MKNYTVKKLHNLEKKTRYYPTQLEFWNRNCPGICALSLFIMCVGFTIAMLRMPKEFKGGVLTKLNNINGRINQSNNNINQINDILYNTIKPKLINVEKRVDLHSSIEEQRAIGFNY